MPNNADDNERLNRATPHGVLMYIDPGNAPKAVITDFFVALEALNLSCGGSGLTITYPIAVYVVGFWKGANSATARLECVRVYFTGEEAEKYRRQRQQRYPELQWSVMKALPGDDWDDWEQM